MMRISAFYLAWFLVAIAVRNPPLMVVVLALLLLRRVAPDPFIFLNTLRRMRNLARQIEQNPANVTARRDLATLYLEQRRPKRAVQTLKDALRRFPNDAELLYLEGLAHHRSGEHELAIDPLVRAIATDPQVRFGEPYLVAGDALRRLGQPEAAIDAYERYLESNSSSIEAQLKLALAFRDARDPWSARASLANARETWRQLPRYKRRKELLWILATVVLSVWMGW